MPESQVEAGLQREAEAPPQKGTGGPANSGLMPDEWRDGDQSV